MQSEASELLFSVDITFGYFHRAIICDLPIEIFPTVRVFSVEQHHCMLRRSCTHHFGFSLRFGSFKSSLTKISLERARDLAVLEFTLSFAFAQNVTLCIFCGSCSRKLDA